MPDRNLHFLGYRCKVDEDNFITYAYGSDSENGAVQVYLAPWKYEWWKSKDQIHHKYIEDFIDRTEAKSSVDPRTDLMPNADAIPTPTEVTTGTDSPRRSPDTVHVPSIYRGR